jgi:hypothetical protein
MPILSFPWGLAALAALPALAAIYWFRSRSRRQVVSSLILWADHRRPRQGGRIFQRMQTPLLLLLELLALLLLALALAGPQVRRSGLIRPLIVVLDDSYSMRAGGSDSPRRRGEAAIVEEMNRARYAARFLLAGARPQLLGRTAGTAEEARGALEAWTCASASADLSRAVALAAEIGGELSRILVVTDSPAPQELPTGQVQWWSFGRPSANIAFSAATRTVCDDGQRVLLEIANLSDRPGETTLTLESPGPAAPRRSSLRLAAGQARRIVLHLAKGTGPLRAALADDVLQIDNRVLLLPESAEPVRVRIEIADARLREVVGKALAASGLARIAAARPELILADRAGPAGGAAAWRLELLAASDPAAYVGPFVMNRAHPLTEGLSMGGVIWAAGKDAATPGTPVITAGNVVLLSDHETFDGRHHVRLCLNPRLSTLQDSPNWPALMWNLLRWRASARSGAAESNVRLGASAVLTVNRGIDSVQVTPPDGEAYAAAVRGGRVAISADRVGQYTIRAANRTWSLACNATSRAESDLSRCRPGQWGSWAGSAAFRRELRDVAWVFLLAALGVLALHAALIARRYGGTA